MGEVMDLNEYGLIVLAGIIVLFLVVSVLGVSRSRRSILNGNALFLFSHFSCWALALSGWVGCHQTKVNTILGMFWNHFPSTINEQFDLEIDTEQVMKIMNV